MASQMTTTFIDKYVKSGDPAHHGPLKPIYCKFDPSFAVNLPPPC